VCGSNYVQWFTPALHAAENAIFLCLACAKINVRFAEAERHALKAS
jgi:hypothetical protein